MRNNELNRQLQSLIRADKPPWKLHRLLHSDTECTDNEIRRAVEAVLAMGGKIMEQAKRQKEDER